MSDEIKEEITETPKPEFTVGGSILWIDGVAYQPGSAFDAVIPQEQFDFFITNGHLIRSEK